MGEGADETLAWPAPLPHSSAQLYSLAEQGFPAMDGALVNVLQFSPMLQDHSCQVLDGRQLHCPALAPLRAAVSCDVQTACSSSSR